ncbi:MAG: hypothetical protein ACRDRR_19845 [Pseudonocardiaceae bacterium]
MIRRCHCGVQLWVNVVMLPTVEAGELAPTCWPCQRVTGKPVTMHDRTVQALTVAGRLEEGWRLIGAMNTEADEPIELEPQAVALRLPAGCRLSERPLTLGSRRPAGHQLPR